MDVLVADVLDAVRHFTTMHGGMQNSNIGEATVGMPSPHNGDTPGGDTNVKASACYE